MNRHYQLIGKETEALLMDGRVFNAKPAVIKFREGRDTEPSDMTPGAVFIDVALGDKTTKSLVSMVEFCVEHGSEDEFNLMAAAASQGRGYECLMYVKHANGSVYEFSAGRFVSANYGGSIRAVFRDVIPVSPDAYTALHSPAAPEEKESDKRVAALVEMGRTLVQFFTTYPVRIPSNYRVTPN